ncbi:MAG TPA: class I SAM-dependent methyltransferase [Hydrogenophaga sp.]|uniref:class I SAM-dependent methyltransferase n=1 Tax=Hydrogenophaga sp. TaxID=1904254 RepID=UPI002CCA8A5E|nr:class I SAM-dependent methyltransferase [Hydrogenophaga sp.]HMN92932.1 class I SAM-dependent methyltransferase [Hydrogenophaga sp.]HMP09765.1 class I SAM-dependent methyltransferase [Hydrogenophaga sp.]
MEEVPARLYTDLAWLWPLWGDAATEYADYDAHVVDLIRRHAIGRVDTLLVIGCGGGKNIFNLKREFEVTGLDISPVMLAQARELNPEVGFVHGDMRSIRLETCFDAVLMDDAIAHMHRLDDFVAAWRTAHAHLRPGGVLIATADVTTESFEQNRTTLGRAGREGLEVVFVENSYDPDPADDSCETTIVYLIREQGRLRVETDHWKTGLFSRATWRQELEVTGFDVHETGYRYGEDSYVTFACVKR